MAKIFYTTEEAAAKLHKTVDEIRQLARDGRLETFHQDGKDLFRVDAVDQLADDDLGLDLELPPEIGSGASSGLDDLGNLDDLNLSDLPPLTDAPLNIDEATPSTSSGAAARGIGFGGGHDDLGPISLEDSNPAGASPAGGAGSGSGLDDLGGDLLGIDPFGGSEAGGIGLAESGSAHGAPSVKPSRGPGASPVAGSPSLGDSSMGGSGSGAGGVMSPGLSDSSIHFGVSDGDEAHLETVGSGSGLLDLTRESEDTSIGAAMLEEEADAGAGASGSGGLEGLLGGDVGGGAGLAEAGAPVPVVGGALAGAGLTLAPAYDGAWSGLTVGAMIASMLAVVVCLMVSSATLFGGSSALLPMLVENFWIVVGSLGGLLLVGMGVGFVVGRATE